MKYVNLSTTYYMDPAIESLSGDAERMFTRAIAYCGNAENRGRITLKAISNLGLRRAQTRLNELVENGILVDVGGDMFEFVNWDKWQESSNALLERREADRLRQQKRRAAGDAESRGLSRDTPGTKKTREEKKRTTTTDVVVGGAVSDEHSPEPSTAAASNPADDEPTLDFDSTPPPEPEPKPAKAKRGTRITADWQPTREAVVALTLETPDVNLRTETANFVDHWLAESGKSATKLDWLAAWRGWMRRQQKWTDERSARTQPRRGSYGVDPNSRPGLSKREQELAALEALKDNPDPRILAAAGLTQPGNERHLTAIQGELTA